MTSSIKIDFYVLDGPSDFKSLREVCNLIETFYLKQKNIYIHVNSQQEAERLDNLLWTYRDISFIPHQLTNQSSEFPAPIQIGFIESPPAQQDVLLNLSTEVPSFFSQFNHVIEIVFSDPTMQQLARNHYKHYRQLGCNIHMQKNLC